MHRAAHLLPGIIARHGLSGSWHASPRMLARGNAHGSEREIGRRASLCARPLRQAMPSASSVCHQTKETERLTSRMCVPYTKKDRKKNVN